MDRLVRCLAPWVAVLAAAGPSLAARTVSPGLSDSAEQDPLPMERVQVFDRPPYEGLIESEDASWIYLIQIQRPKGHGMHLVVRPIDRRQVASVVRLGEAQRARLRQEIERFRNRAAIESGRMEAVALEEVQAEGNTYQRYCGKWFTLDSTADEVTTRRVIVRTEQVFAAYRQILPPRTAPRQPPRLVVFGSMGEYQAFLGRLGVKIQNRACFLPEQNLVAAGTELTRLVTLMAKLNAQNDQLRRQLKDLEKRLAERLRDLAERLKKDGLSTKETSRLLNLERRKFDQQSRKLRDDLARSDREAAQVFNQHAGQTFARLYHESFHAYLEDYVYPRRQFEVPCWLNEGLAVMFEGGVLEGDTLRIDAPNPTALKKLKEDLRSNQPLAMEKLLAAGPEAFLSQGETAAADRYYAHAWGLAHYLAFEKQLLGNAALDRYVQPDGVRERQPRFEELVERPLADFQQQWRAYILALRTRP